MKLTELLNSIDAQKEMGLINIEDWRWPEVAHLTDMGFKIIDEYHMETEKPPKMTIYKKKSKDESMGESISHFYIEEPNKPIKRFKSFDEVIHFFDYYEQPQFNPDDF